MHVSLGSQPGLPQAAVAAIRHSTYVGSVEALGAADYRGVLELLEVAGEVDGVDPFPEPVLAAMRRLIPADVVSYGELDLGGAGWRAGIRWHGVPALAGVTPGIQEAHVRFTDQMPHPPWAPIAGWAARWSDLLSRRRLQRLDVYAEVGRPLGAEYELELWLLTPHGVVASATAQPRSLARSWVFAGDG